MKLLLFTCMALGSSALRAPNSAWKERVTQHSTTRSQKAFCKSASEMQNGTWVLLDEGEFHQAPKVCNPIEMMYEPDTCKLPYHSDEMGEQNGRVVIVGDSITDNAARSFAWFYGNYTGAQWNNCQYTRDDFRGKMAPKLRKVGLKQTQIDFSLDYMEANGFRKNHHWWGCDTKVMYVPSDMPPQGSAVKGFMQSIKHFPSEPLGPEDTIVLNWGAWEKDDTQHQWPDKMLSFFKEFKKWQKEGTAPKLIWREVSPMHWGADGGKYTKADFEKTQITESCSFMGPKMIEKQLQRDGQFPLSNTAMFKTALKGAGLKIDGKNIEFLPIWKGSAERYEDHQLLSKYQKENKATIDCTHFCVHGNVHRFWNSALLATITNMKNKEV